MATTATSKKAAPYLAHSLATFRTTINLAFPNRDKRSDGWIGDEAHANRKSEHNPDGKGCVHAIDVDIDDNNTGRDLRKEILASTIGHPAVWYVISNGIIWSRTHGWKARRYTGPNPHFSHVHISIRPTAAAEKDITLRLRGVAKPAPWGAFYGGRMGTRVLRRWCRGGDVRALQDVLNKWYPKRKQLAEDGWYGPDTETTVRYMQSQAKLPVTGIVDARTWNELGVDDRIPA